MANYSVSNDLAGTKQAMSTSYKTLIVAKAATATLRRAWVYELIVGTNGTPADAVMEYDISRQTADGTATAATPLALDSADTAAGTVCAVNATAEGTITATSSVYYMAGNVRATYNWKAYDPSSRLVIPATNLAGLALRAKSPATYTSTASAQLYFQE